MEISSTQEFELHYYLKRGVNTELIKSCHLEFSLGSYQRGNSTFTMGKILKQVQNDTKGMANLVGWGFHNSQEDNGIFPPVQSKIATLRNGGIVMLRLPKPCTSASLFRLHIGSRIGGVECQ